MVRTRYTVMFLTVVLVISMYKRHSRPIYTYIIIYTFIYITCTFAPGGKPSKVSSLCIRGYSRRRLSSLPQSFIHFTRRTRCYLGTRVSRFVINYAIDGRCTRISCFRNVRLGGIYGIPRKFIGRL